jgi:hypothetical protein
MPLEFQTVDVKFTQGQDTRTQKKLRVAGKWDKLLNYSLSENNTPLRRDGVSAVVPTANANGLATYGTQLITINGGSVATVSTAPTTPIANPVTGRLGYVNVSKTEVRRSVGMQDLPDCASGGGFTMYCWQEKSTLNVVTGIGFTLVDETTGAKVIDTVTVGGTLLPRCIYNQGAFFLFFMAGTSLFCSVIQVSAPTTIGAAVALITSANLKIAPYDVCAFGSPSGGATAACMVSYGWTDGATSIRTIRVQQTAGVPAIGAGPTNLFTEAQLPNATITGICCAAYSEQIHAATFVTSTGAAAMAGLAGRVIVTSWATSTAAVQINNAAAATTSACHVAACINDGYNSTVSLQVFWDRVSEWGTNAFNPLKTVVLDIALAANGVAVTTVLNSATFGAGSLSRGPQGPFIGGKPFNSGGTVFLPVYIYENYNGRGTVASNPRTLSTQNTFFVMEFQSSTTLATQLNVVAKALYGTYGLASVEGSTPLIGTPCSTPLIGSGSYAIAVGEVTRLELSGVINVTQAGIVRLTLTPQLASLTTPPVTASLGETTYIAGGSLSDYDGSVITEHGFPTFPEGCGFVAGGGGSGTMDAGVHQVVAIYEWVDAAGQLHQSAPSLPVSVTTVATGSIALTVPTLLLSEKGGAPNILTNVSIVAYCTTAGGLTFFRSNRVAGVYAVTANSLAVKDVTITIDSPDATLAANEPLYTQPNIPSTLANIAPGPTKFVWVAQNRLWFDIADQPNFFGFSQEYINNVGLQFNPSLTDSLPTESGGFAAGAALDEKVIVFGRNRIYAKYGNGPTPSGGFSSYSRPLDVQSDVGCSDPLSVLDQGPGGIIFKAQNGWHVLGRDLSVKYIGAGVSSYDAQRVTSAVLLLDRKEARFTLSTGVTLVYSTLVGEWSVFMYGSNTEAGAIVSSAVWWQTLGFYTWVGVSSGLNSDVPGLAFDTIGASAPSVFTMQARTTFLKLGTLEGFQRVKKMYLTATASSLTTLDSTFGLTVYFDDSYTGVGYAVTNFNTNVLGASSPSAETVDFRHTITTLQKCKSIAFQFNESATSTSKTALSGIQALALEIGVKPGVKRLPAAQTVG